MATRRFGNRRIGQQDYTQVDESGEPVKSSGVSTRALAATALGVAGFVGILAILGLVGFIQFNLPKDAVIDIHVPGPYDVGFIQRVVTLPGGQSNVNVWYPMARQNATPRYLNPEIDGSTTYSFDSTNVLSFFDPTGLTFVPSRLKALKDGPPASGKFPIYIISHGGGSSNIAGTDTPFGYAPTDEYLASHGVIAVNYNRVRSGDGSATDKSALIDYLLNATAFSLYPHVDSEKIVVGGHSSGGHAAQAVAGGVVDQSLRDPRVKGLVLKEAATVEDEVGSFEQLAVPSLYFGRIAIAPYADFYDYSATMDAAIHSNPRYYSRIDGAGHLAYETGTIEIIKAMREANLVDGNTAEPLIHPLFKDYSLFSHFQSLDPRGRYGFARWNLPELFFAEPATFPVEGFTVHSNTPIGVVDSLLDTDLDNDNFADEAAYITGVAAAPSMTNTTIHLQSTLVLENGFNLLQADYAQPNTLNGYFIRILSGTGVGQGRNITGWSGAPDYIATVAGEWATDPDDTSAYLIGPNHGPSRRRTIGSFILQPYITVENQRIIHDRQVLAFIKSAVCHDARYKKYLESTETEQLQQIGLTSLRTENGGGGAKKKRSIPHKRSSEKMEMFARFDAIIAEWKAMHDSGQYKK